MNGYMPSGVRQRTINRRIRRKIRNGATERAYAHGMEGRLAPRSAGRTSPDLSLKKRGVAIHGGWDRSTKCLE
jgi:hypothetical protein